MNAKTTQPVLLLVAGPNGAGKTTFAEPWRRQFSVVNADMVMLENDLTPYQAGRVTIQRLMEHIEQKNSCIYETTISGSGLLRHIRNARGKGFLIFLYYIGLERDSIAVERVKVRYKSGQGHLVPENDIIRRYHRSLKNTPDFIKLSDYTLLLDNSSHDSPFREVCEIYNDKSYLHEDSPDIPQWAQNILKAMGHL